jgi:glycosyltransferase involved in cell wall biosynthesis
MTGFQHARGDLIATTDGDHTYPLEDLPRLVRILDTDRLDFLTTDRFALLDPKAMSSRRRFGNRILTLAARLLFDVNIRDSQSGMWVFKREKAQRLLLRSNLAFSQEIKIEAVHFAKLRWREVPIHYRSRVGEAKFGRFNTGLRLLLALLLARVQRSHSG